MAEFLHEGLSALTSYDGKLWLTLRVLSLHPGQLTKDYLEGRRMRYLSPLQLFLWLETITFAAHRLLSSDPRVASEKAEELIVVGAALSVGIAVFDYPWKRPFLSHVVFAVHLWAFLMLLLMGEYAIVVPLSDLFHGSRFWIGEFVTWSAQMVMLGYASMAIKRVYAQTWAFAALRAVLLFAGYAALLGVLQSVFPDSGL